MPKLKNTIQFSLDTQRLEALALQAEGEESLGLTAKRFVIDRLEGIIAREPVSSGIEERFKIIDDKFMELISRIERLEGTGSNSSSGELGTVLDEIKRLGDRFDQSTEVTRLRSMVSIQQAEINDQQEKIDTLEFQLRQALKHNDEITARFLELEEKIQEQQPSNIDLEENLLEAPGELDQPDQPFEQTFSEASREEEVDDLDSEDQDENTEPGVMEILNGCEENTVYWLNGGKKTLGFKVKDGVLYGFVGANSEARLKKYRAKFFGDTAIWERFTYFNNGGREVSARWELRLSSHEPGSALVDLKLLKDYDFDKDPDKQQR